MKRLLLGAVLALALTGCSTMPESNADDPARVIAVSSVKIVTRQAIGHYIQKKGPEKSFERAQRVKHVAEGVRAVVNGDTAVTIAELTAVALAAVPASFTPADRMAAVDVVDAVGKLISSYVGEGALDPSKTVLVRDALDWIIEAAAFYVPPT